MNYHLPDIITSPPVPAAGKKTLTSLPELWVSAWPSRPF